MEPDMTQAATECPHLASTDALARKKASNDAIIGAPTCGAVHAYYHRSR